MKLKVNRETLREMIKDGDDVSNVDTSGITDMSYLFYWCKSFNQDISGWDVSNVEHMSYIFRDCDEFNQDISGWDVSNVKDMYNMFEGCKAFNQDVSKWNVSSVKYMQHMFTRCKNFEYKNFKRKINVLEHVIKEDDFLNFNKEELLDYLSMYKEYDGMKIKVLETLSKEKISEKVFERFA